MADAPSRLTINEYAAHRKALGLTGGTHQAVRKAIKDGRIQAAEPGPPPLLDPAVCDRAWEANSSPGKRESGAAGGQAAQVKHGKVAEPTRVSGAQASAAPPTRRKPRAATAPAPDYGDGEAGIDPETGLRTFNASRAQKEHYLAEKSRLEFLQLDGTLVVAEEVRREAARTARMVKDALLALPDRLCGELAALTDPHAVFVKLREEITAALAALAEKLPAPGDTESDSAD